MTDFFSVKKLVDAAVGKWTEKFSPDTVLNEAVRYALDGGKRLRPVMLITGAAVSGVDAGYAMPFAVAMELIHNYSLIHDDMPCMDNDDFRRGRPSVHKKFGEWQALLAGDALLNGAYELILKNCSDAKQLKAGRIIAKSAGEKGMIHGQLLDLSHGCANSDALLNICKYKTGALFTGALTAGAALGGAGIKIKAALRDFGENFGLAFQIADDLDDFRKLNEFDKALAFNYAAVCGERAALEDKKHYLDMAKNSIKNLKNVEILTELANLL